MQVLCKNGRIEGAAKFGREWAIPATAEKPGDDRFVNGKYVAWRKKSPKIRETNTGIKGNQDKLDKWDYAISISSGAITASSERFCSSSYHRWVIFLLVDILIK